MMNKTVLQIPVSKSLRAKAEGAALDYGFSSLQEVIRVFMTKLAQRTVEVSFREVRELSSEAKTRYQKIDKDFSEGENVHFARTVGELKTQFSR